MNKKTFLILTVLLFSFSAFCTPQNAKINKFDSLVIRPYNRTLDTVSNGAALASALTPAFLAGCDKGQYPLIGTMYIETMGISWATKQLMKNSIHRERPYMNFEGAPQEDIESGNYKRSFPSGHTMLAFASAAFTSYTFCKYNPQSQYKTPVVVTSLGLATATAATRILSGNHYLSDVLVSAAIGSIIGVSVPAIHGLFAKTNKTSSQSTPFAFVFGFSL